MLGALPENPRIPVTFPRILESSLVEFSIPAIWVQRIPARKLVGGQKSWQELLGGNVSSIKKITYLFNTIGGQLSRRHEHRYRRPSDSRSVHLRHRFHTPLPCPRWIGKRESGITEYPSTIEDGNIVPVRPAVTLGSGSRRRALGSRKRECR